MNLLGRVLFFRAGMRELVRDEIERRQERERKSIAKIEKTIEKQLQKLQRSDEAASQNLRKLAGRYDDLLEKYDAATKLVAQQRERLGTIRADLQSFKKAHVEAHVEERVTTLERAWHSDHEEELCRLISQLESRFPVPTVAAHVQQVIAHSPMMHDPYPHVVLEDVLPDALHALLYETLPPQDFWRAGREKRQNWTIGEDLAPLRTSAAWRFMDDLVVPGALLPALTTMFESYLQSQQGHERSAAGDGRLTYERSGGRLMLRHPGYHFEPHLDPRRALLTGLFYLGRPEDSHDYGTKLFRSNGTIPDPEMRRGVYYPLREGATCELVKTIPSRPNSMLVFASRIGLHGADIPADAQPPTLERYTYQFYIGALKSN